MSTSTEIIPVLPPDTTFRTWLKGQLYKHSPTGRFVPNVDDEVRDWDQGILRVSAVDETTYESTLVAWTAPKAPENDNIEDLLQGTGPGAPIEKFRCYYDASVLPYRLGIDSATWGAGSMCKYAKIFKGTDISKDTGVVISRHYDSAGNLIGENIPLELIATEKLDNVSMKSVFQSYTNTKLQDGELVTVVFYDDASSQRSKAILLVQETTFIRSQEANQRYITSIELLSPFLSKVDPKVLEFPSNLTVESVALMARVNYTDGKKDLAIDGSKFQLLGLQNFLTTIVGKGGTVPLTLRYEVGSDETAYADTAIGNKVLVTPYTAKAIATDGAYSVKLYCFPCWNEEELRYELHWFLYNLNRDQWYAVDNYVELGSNSNPFKPTLFGTEQDLVYAIDLSAIDPRFAKYRHVQRIKLTLLRSGSAGTVAAPLWCINYDSTYDHPYGLTQVAELTHISGTNYKCVLNSVHQYFDIWLERFYKDTYPLVLTDTTPPLIPTHFVLDANGFTQEYTIDAWREELIIPTLVPAGENLYLRWIRRDGDTDLQLGVSAVRVVHV